MTDLLRSPRIVTRPSPDEHVSSPCVNPNHNAQSLILEVPLPHVLMEVHRQNRSLSQASSCAAERVPSKESSSARSITPRAVSAGRYSSACFLSCSDRKTCDFNVEWSNCPTM